MSVKWFLVTAVLVKIAVGRHTADKRYVVFGEERSMTEFTAT
jgi:hypothetical protein